MHNVDILNFWGSVIGCANTEISNYIKIVYIII